MGSVNERDCRGCVYYAGRIADERHRAEFWCAKHACYYPRQGTRACAEHSERLTSPRD